MKVLPSSVTFLRTNGAQEKHVYVIGTAHVSKVSVEEVYRAIYLIQPDTVVLELCGQR